MRQVATPPQVQGLIDALSEDVYLSISSPRGLTEKDVADKGQARLHGIASRFMAKGSLGMAGQDGTARRTFCPNGTRSVSTPNPQDICPNT